MRTFLLIGAGAGSSASDPVPPLGAQLYDSLCVFAPWLRSFTQGFEKEYRDDFEAAMVRFIREKEGHNAIVLTKVLAAYLFSFTPSSNNLYFKLLDALSLAKVEFLLCTLNYDLMIERSAELLGIGTRYGGEPDMKQCLTLLKVHGSCNLLPVLYRTAQLSHNYISGPGEGLIEGPMYFSRDGREIRDFLWGEFGQWAPGICYFAPGKPIFMGREVINQQYKRVCSWCNECEASYCYKSRCTGDLRPTYLEDSRPVTGQTSVF